MNPVKSQYEQWPYPRVPMAAYLHREQLWQINVQWIQRRCGLVASPRPKLWIAGCGTFQPYTFSRANPDSTILATDISQASLEISKKTVPLTRRAQCDVSRA